MHYLIIVASDIGDDIDMMMETFNESNVSEHTLSKEELLKAFDEDLGWSLKNAIKDSGYMKKLEEKKLWSDEDKLNQMYRGDEPNKDGSLTRFYNPDGKWDWFKIGGRWENWLNTSTGPSNGSFKRDIIKNEDLPYGILIDGEWTDRDYIDDEEWKLKYNELYDALDDDIHLTVVDIHN